MYFTDKGTAIFQTDKHFPLFFFYFLLFVMKKRLTLHRKRYDSMKKELGKILIDIAKLVIGGVILAGLMRQDIPPVYLFTVGGIAALLMIVSGLVLISWKDKSNN
jgi:uncharacterized membrane protein YraQ (UPF0718 family)